MIVDQLTIPKGACCCHAHVFRADYPYIQDRAYTPEEAHLKHYTKMLSSLGVQRGVLVQPSVYGTDNRLLLDSMKAISIPIRGVAVIDESVSDREIEQMHAAGVRGVRFNLLFKGGISLNILESMAERIREFGWHIQVLMDVTELPGVLNRLCRLPVDFVFDHMGHMPASQGVSHAGFQALLEIVKRGRGWVKLSGPYRFSAEDYPYTDVSLMAQALVSTAPGRILWGTDWPHPAAIRTLPPTENFRDLLGVWVDDEGLRTNILVENPTCLYGF